MAITQRSLYKTIEKIGEQHYLTDADLLVAILDEIIRNERIKIIGGRIWRLSPKEKKYHLIYEEGKIDPIGKDFRIDLNEYAVFGEVARNRTVLADETNRALKSSSGCTVLLHTSIPSVHNRIKFLDKFGIIIG